MAIEKDFVWEESRDVYRPKQCELFREIATLALEKPPVVRAGQALVAINRAAYASLRLHLQRDLKNESGGLLIGEASFDPHLNSYLLVIHEALPAESADETEFSISFTAETWAQLMPQIRHLNPAFTIVGSYHSHPGMGVFLSPTDLETQAGVFPYPWQTALVVDPIADDLGFFMGEKGKPCKSWVLF